MEPREDQHDRYEQHEGHLDGSDESERESPRIRRHIEDLGHDPDCGHVAQCPLDQLATLQPVEYRGNGVAHRNSISHRSA